MVKVILQQLCNGLTMNVRPTLGHGFDKYKLEDQKRLICYHGIGILKDGTSTEIWTTVPQPHQVLLYIGTRSGVYKDAEFKFTLDKS
jgi:hypothetical protein